MSVYSLILVEKCMLRLSGSVFLFACLCAFSQAAVSHGTHAQAFALSGRTQKVAQKSVHVASASSQEHFLLGSEVVTSALLFAAAGKTGNKNGLTIGLITNQTGKDQRGRRTLDVLRKKGISIARIFVPEHGLAGTVKASHDVVDSLDEKTGIPVISLFGNGSGKALDAVHLSDLDLLVFELQDSGMRHYTYISTLFLVMQAAAQYNKPLMILDRPNPLKHPMEGPLVEPELHSFISIASVPVRHGMTMGELARYFNAHVLEKKVDLHVVAMRHYNRLQGLPGKLPAQLSPHLQSKEACYGYSFLGLLGEVKPFDVGLGTEYALRSVALPETVRVPHTFWVDLAQRLKKIGVHSKPLRFYSPRKKLQCTGLFFTLSDPALFSSFQVLVSILTFMHKAGVPLIFSAAFDKAAGTAKLREYVQGDFSRALLARQVNEQLHRFYEEAKTSFLYTPAPKVVFFSDKVQ
ncbi:hypothetical protein CVU75_03785 [Candidatus Dependentiae bacterium HGW-Dependentiae-1]|nr:MAG: hypothetical protein CVU75_03785 [Candidatus Dependentiae bacterium HGW-Dependentiae-1]